jgi:hypothetical protein
VRRVRPGRLAHPGATMCSFSSDDFSLRNHSLSSSSGLSAGSRHEARTRRSRAEEDLTWFFAGPDDEARAAPIRERLAALSPVHRGTLELRFVPRRLPAAIERAFVSLASVVLRVECSDHPSQATPSVEAAEARAVQRLEEALARGLDRNRIRRLRRRARRLVKEAMVAYAPPRPRYGPGAARSLTPPGAEPPEVPPDREAAPRRDPPEKARREASIAERELVWFFATTDEEVSTLPSNFALTLPSAREHEGPSAEDLADALHDRRRIRDWLRSIPDSDAGVLQVAFESGTWPEAIERVFGGRLAGIAVRLMCDAARWPAAKWAQDEILSSKRSLLVARILAQGDTGAEVQRLRRAAVARLTKALCAYHAARGSAPCAGRDLS